MSYDVDTWKVKKLKNLAIPVDGFFVHPRKDWHPEKSVQILDQVEYSCFDSISIVGTEKGGMLYVSLIECSGEGSGTFLDWILEPALKHSTGELIVVRVWEGGDSIDKLIVKNGVLKTKKVEL